jgi:hypothetical protein
MRNILSSLALSILSLVSSGEVSRLAYADVRTSNPGQWSGGGGVGFLASTPDGIEFAVAGHADFFVTPPFSVGPLVQFAGGGNDLVLGVSAQAKYWWSIPGTRDLARVVVQGGIGFVWADIEDSDTGAAGTYTSFLIPLGVGFDYAVTRTVAITVDFVLNLTSLGEDARVGGREVDLHTNVMPGLYLGVRF